MRSLRKRFQSGGGSPAADRSCARGVAAVCVLLAAPLLGGALAAQDFDDELLLPTAISESDIEMRGRYAHQWKQADGTLVLLFQGDFRLDAGDRRLIARDAVVWINSGRTDPANRRFWDLTVYLWGDAEVHEPAGTITTDDRLLVSNLRTFGRLVKFHDAHAPESMEESVLYQEALRERTLIESGRDPDADPSLEVSKPGQAGPRTDRPQRVISYRIPFTEPATTPSGETVQVARGRVYFSQSGGSGGLIEIQADNAVVFPATSGSDILLREEVGGEGDVIGEPDRGQDPQGRDPEQEPRESDVSSRISRQIRGVYLEGDVVLSAGSRFVRADRLYYDFENERALILDAVLRVEIPQRGIPIYIRADEIRQLSATEYLADSARLTTSEFYTPHYHIGAERVYIHDKTQRGAAVTGGAEIQGEYEMRNLTLNVGGLPIAWWPYSRGEFRTSETAMRSFRIGYSDDFGAGVETRWHLFNLLGAPSPPGFDSTLRLDYFNERGPAVGVNLDYEFDDSFGLLRSYFIHDDGEDNLGRFRDNTPDTSERGRFTLRHRQYLPRDWQLTFEISYISDPNFLEEYEESEFDEGKEQETLIYLKRARGTEAITFLANWRLLDFVTQTEHLPDLGYRRIGDTWFDPIVLYHESRLGVVRMRPDDRRFFNPFRRDNTRQTDSVFRTDVREEAELPLKLGPLNLVPFATVRGSFWDSAPHRDGSLWRGFASYGARGSMQFSRVFDEVKSQLLDIDRIRHIIRPDFAAWWAHSSARSTRITPFDEGVETIDGFYGGMIGLRQTWQTKRGVGDNRRTVDLLTLNLEAGFFGGDVQVNEISNGYVNPIRPEDSRTRNYFAGDLIYRMSDTTSLLYDFNFDLNDGSYDQHNVSLAIERLPRLAYVFGVRHAGDIDMNLVGGGFNYKLTEKHIIAARSWFDIDTGQAGEVALTYIKKLPRWYVGFNFEYDQVDDDFSLSFSFWPEGVPEWALGSRRFTGVSTTTGIRP